MGAQHYAGLGRGGFFSPRLGRAEGGKKPLLSYNGSLNFDDEDC